MDESRDLQQQTTDLLLQRPSASATRDLAGGPPFSPFRPTDLARATALTDRLLDLADRSGVQAVLDEVARLNATDDPALVKHAFLVFLTHHPEAQGLTIPPLEQREPEILPSSDTEEAATRDLDTAGDPEAQLAWYREDPAASEHHEHWHLVYPAGGVRGQRKDRQGELFVYMHEQMLARYDTERLAAGLSPVVALSDYRVPIAEGYDPGPRLRASFSPRPPGMTMADIEGYTVAAHEQHRDHLRAAISAGSLQAADGSHAPITPDLLGATLEASINSASSDPTTQPPAPDSFYGQLHNYGHVLIGALQTGAGPGGVMNDTATAIRDPVFYRWHRHVDDLAFAWQERQPPNTFTDAPKVRLRRTLTAAKAPGTAGPTTPPAPAVPTPPHAGPDIILAFMDSIPGSSSANFDGAAYGQAHFGGANWNKPFATGGVTTAELHTQMKTRHTQGVTVPYLDQRTFCYFLRVENLRATAQAITVRIFGVATQAAADRRMWIELDKFTAQLAARQKAVLYRPAALSSVIRQPALKPPGATGLPSGDNYCNCGWPYNLLLPRGTRVGLPFRLLVFCTDATQDHIQAPSGCGSMSYCGSKDRYPDRRSMGYPFDRPFSAGHSLAQTLAGGDHLATRDIVIRWVD